MIFQLVKKLWACVERKQRELVAFKKAGLKVCATQAATLHCRLICSCLTTESVEGLALSLESVDDVHSNNSLPLGVLSVSDSIPDHALQVVLQNTSGLFVDQSADSLDTTSSSQTSDGWFCDSLDVVA